jgi:hypothetical protein
MDKSGKMPVKKQSVVLWVIALSLVVLATGIFLISISNSKFVAAYKIGDQGPAGGIIFYIDNASKFENFDYLESAPSLCEGQEKLWALTPEGLASAIKVVSTWETDSIGSGQQSTDAMLKVSKDFYDLKTASGFAHALECGGKSDWFVPSKSELDLMYQNLALNEIGEFSDGYYWSSSYYLAGRAWNRPFNDGVSFDGNKDGNFAVRPIRAF